MSQQIQLRRGTALAWTTANPILALGEMGVETDTNRLKVGSGSATWTSLSYITGTGGSGTVTSIAGTGTQGVTISGSPITTSGTLSIGLGAITPTSVLASGTVGGSNLSGTNTGDQTITLTGDITGSGTGSFVTTLSNTAVTAGTYGSTTQVPVIVVDAKGRITSVTTASISGGSGSVTSVSGSGGATGLTLTGGPITNSGTLTLGGTLAITAGGTGQTTASDAISALLPSQTGLSGYYLSTNGSTVVWAPLAGTGTVTSVSATGSADIAVGGSPITTSGILSFALSNTSVTPGTYGSSSSIPVIAVDAKGRLTSVTNTAISVNVAQGGTGLASLTAGSVLLGAGTSAVSLVAPGSTGNLLTSNGSSWISSPSSGTGLPAGGIVNQFIQNVASGQGAWHTLVSADVTDLATLTLNTNDFLVGTSGAPVAKTKSEVQAILSVDKIEIPANIFGAVSNGTYTLQFKSPVGYTINSSDFQLTSGTCTIAIAINGTNITGLAAISATSSLVQSTATAANVVTAGQTITMIISAGSTPIGLSGSINATRN